MTAKKTDNLFITGDNSFQAYADQTESDLQREPIPRGHAKTMASSNSRTFENWAPNISVRSDYNQADFEFFRLTATPVIQMPLTANSISCTACKYLST